MENKEFKNLFISESREHIDNLNNFLVLIEKNSEDKDTINNIFRVFHTLKSNSSTMGYDKFSKISHKLEDLLELIRNEKIKIDRKIMDILFEGLDFLEEGLKYIESDNDDKLMPESLIEKIESFNKKNENAVENNIIADKAELSEKDIEKLKELKIKKSDIRRLIITFKEHPLKKVKALTVLKKIESDKDNVIIRIKPSKQEIIEGTLAKDIEIIIYSKNYNNLPEKIKKISKIDYYQILNFEDVYHDKNKELKKFKIIEEHRKELKKVQEVRIDIKKLDNLMNMTGELLIHKMRLEKINEELLSKDLEAVAKSISILTQNIQNEVLDERMIPIGSVFSRLPRIVRDLSKEEGKNIEFVMIGDDNKLDRTVIDKIIDPLVHIIRNSVDHGIEKPDRRKELNKNDTGIIKLNAKREKNHVVIEIEDDGAGINPDKIKQKAIDTALMPIDELNSMSKEELQQLVFKPGFSTNDRITEISGRGVGMDVVETNIKKVGGNINLKSVVDNGTKIRIELPLTMAIITVLIINVSNEKYAIPLTNILKTLKITSKEIKTIQNKETFILRDEDIPLLRLKEIIGLDFVKEDEITVIIVEYDNKKVGLTVDSIDKIEQILLKNVGEKIKKVKGIAGGTILGDGKVCFILDIASLISLS